MTKTIKLDYITKIEGHAKLRIKVDKGKFKDAKLSIFEGSRFFEGILKGKKYDDLAPISSRICGVCSVAHALASIKAVENAFNVLVSDQTNILRELLTIGGIIQSHILHLYFLALPDYLGYSSAIEMARKHNTKLKTAFRIKNIGNQIVRVVGGRDIHPLAAVIGGFSRLPDKVVLKKLLKDLKAVKKDAVKTVKLFSSFKYPCYSKEADYFALQGGSYFYSDKIISCVGKTCIPTNDYERHFQEYFKEGSTAEFVIAGGKSYRVGALARIVNNQNLLSKEAQKYIADINEMRFCPFMNNIAQAVEILEGVNRSIEILENLKLEPEEPAPVDPKQAVGIGAIEAPRGILFHKYCFDSKGYCTSANITTPTSQNLQNIEDNIKIFLPIILHKKKENIQLDVEKLIRSYDPCISCSTHFLKIVWDKS